MVPGLQQRSSKVCSAVHPAGMAGSAIVQMVFRGSYCVFEYVKTFENVEDVCSDFILFVTLSEKVTINDDRIYLLFVHVLGQVCQLIFFIECSSQECSSRQLPSLLCPRCFCVESMKEDVDDACSSLAVAGILVGAYAISTKPLPETNYDNLMMTHSISMLAVFGILAAVIAAVHLVHATVKYSICASQPAVDAAAKQHEA